MVIQEHKAKLNFSELTKIENEQNWKFIRLLIALSIGILAFSIQTYDNSNNSTWLVKISWIAFLISFISGLQNLRYFQKILSRESKRKEIIEGDESEAKENEIEKFKREIDKFVKRDKRYAVILRLSFVVGIITYVAFKFINVW